MPSGGGSVRWGLLFSIALSAVGLMGATQPFCFCFIKQNRMSYHTVCTKPARAGVNMVCLERNSHPYWMTELITHLSKSALLTTAFQIPRQVPLCFPIGRVLGKVSVINAFKHPTVSALHVRHSSRVLESQLLQLGALLEPPHDQLPRESRIGPFGHQLYPRRFLLVFAEWGGGRGRSARRQAEANCRSRASCP